MLAHSRTEKNINNYLSSPSSGLAIMGQRGAGKEFIARHIAESLLQVSSTENHPHVHFIDAKEVDGAIDTVRLLRKKLNLVVPSASSVRRVVIIAHFDAFGHEAQNAMLKTLEEPPLGTVFLLTIDHEHQVLPTIYSRVHRLDVLPLPAEAVKGFGSGTNPTLVAQSYQISQGSAGLFASLVTGDSNHPMTVAITEAKKVLLQPKHVQIASVDSIVKNKQLSTTDFLDGMLRILVASHKVQLTSSDLHKQRQSNKRVKLVLRSIKDLRDGVSQKLVLTQLFFDL